MLTYYSGTDLYSLADQLINELDEKPAKNVLAPEVFVVQNHGMANWLSLYLADQKGIAANLEFEFPAERIWKLIRTIDPDIPKDLPSDRHPMTWSLMKLLKDPKVLSEYPKLEYYIGDGKADENIVRAWKLCSRIADVFDQYLIYRPVLIEKWEQGQLQNPKSKTEQWQARLWEKLKSEWKSKGYNQNWMHRVELQRELLEQIESGNLDLTKLPQRITVFGVSMMPPAFTKVFTKLSGLIDVCFYQFKPVSNSDPIKNSLVQSLGNIFAEQQGILRKNFEHAEELSNTAVAEDEKPKESLLQAVQSDLKNDRKDFSNKVDTDTSDRSIQIHSCHSPMREVEVLYDQLLAALDENSDLNPDDILIMTPDIQTYSPVIEAVFGSPEEGQPAIPFQIADRSTQSQQSVKEVFLTILTLCESRFKVTDVINLIENDIVKESFGFDEEDIELLLAWIQDNKIWWGVNGSFKEKMGLPKSDSFTWKSGLNKMMAGFVMKPNEDELFKGIYPYKEIESSENAVLTGKLYGLMQKLFELHELIQKDLHPKDWCNKLLNIIDTFLPDSRDYYWQLSELRKAVKDLASSAELGGFSQAISFSIVRMWLENYLEEQATGGGGLGRGVTFSSLKPMRSIPFKMIGMIGMDEGKFPKSKIPIEFNLIESSPKEGDPVRAEEDRYLFLENILLAKEHLYFSYVGQSNQQDVKFPPSVVLKEFLDYLEESYGIDSKSLVKEHPLQGFSNKYFEEDSLFTYSKTKEGINESLSSGALLDPRFLNRSLSSPEEDWKSTSINELVSFYQHPARYLLRNRIGIYLSEEETITEAREPFALKGLESYSVGQELLQRFMEDKPLSSHEEHLRARDMLPEGWSGEQAFRQKTKEVEEFGANLKSEIRHTGTQSLEVNLTIDDFQVVGKIANIYPDAVIDFRFGSMRPKDLSQMWIRHLCFQQLKPEGHPGLSKLFTRDKKKPFVEYRLGEVEDPGAVLSGLLETYLEGLQANTFFFPESSFAYAHEVYLNKKDKSAGLYKASKKWVREWGSYPGEGEDPYNKLLLGDENPLESKEFHNASIAFWGPFFDALILEDS